MPALQFPGQSRLSSGLIKLFSEQMSLLLAVSAVATDYVAFGEPIKLQRGDFFLCLSYTVLVDNSKASG